MTPHREAGRYGSLYLSINLQLITIVFIAQVTVAYQVQQGKTLKTKGGRWSLRLIYVLPTWSLAFGKTDSFSKENG
jgi:hypothetical protein